MRVKKLIRDTLFAFLAQGISLFLSITTSLVMPKLLGVAEYGYWQLFVFYVNYVGIFHLGLNDGVYLINGGKTRSTLDRRSIKSQFVIATSYELIGAALICICACTGVFGPKRSAVLLFTGIYMPLINASGFLGYIFQSLNETKLFSFSIILDKLIFLVPLVLLLLAHVTQFEWYAAFYAISKACSLLYCLCKARDILSEKPYPLRQSVRLVWTSIKVGLKLMFALIANMLVLGIAQFVSDYRWGVETFGKLSFSISLVNFFIVFISQASMVLFPALRQADEQELRHVYRRMRDVMELGFPAFYLCYFPIVWIMGLWLPQYALSFRLFILLLPLCVFDTKMDICCTTYLKVLRKEKQLLFINFATCALSTILVVVSAFVFSSVYLVVGSVTFAIVARSFISELYLNKQMNVEIKALSVEEMMVTIVFIALNFLLEPFVAFVIYGLVYVAYLVINRQACAELISAVVRMAKK